MCDEAHAVLIQHGLQPTTIDIDTDIDLTEKWDTCVPVVEIDGKIRFRGRVDPLLLKRLIHT